MEQWQFHGACVFLKACLRQNDEETWDIHREFVRLGDLPPIEYYAFTRRGHSYGSDMYHGCVLSPAYSILQDGFRVGRGTHCHNGRSCTGLFGFTSGTLRSALGLALGRTHLERCTETMTGGKICGWGVPAVHRISRPEPITRLHMVGDCYKSVWEQSMGSSIQLGEIEVFVPVAR